MAPRRRPTLAPAWVALVVLLLLAASCGPSAAFKPDEFKKCDDAGFCKRNRDRPPAKHTYAVEGAPKLDASGALVADVVNEANGAKFVLEVSPYLKIGEGLIRARMTEPPGTAARFEVPDVLLPELPAQRGRWMTALSAAGSTAVEAPGGPLRVVLLHRPLRLEVWSGSSPLFVLNGQQLLNYEHRRTEKTEADEPGMWEETFRSWTDPKKNGPEGVAIDLGLPGVAHVYGLPERATSFALPATHGEGVSSEPYRLYNLDVFEYLPESPFGLYGSVPYLLGIQGATGRTVGAFWLNSAEMFVDVEPLLGPAGGHLAHLMAEAGILDLFLMTGPTPAEVFAQYASLTGAAALPPLFSLGYHQCRWNYRDDADATAVDAGFDTHDMPYDVLWLDIEHTDGKRYMTWDKAAFPDPVGLQNRIGAKGREMVAIVDPHLKRDAGYAIHAEASARGYYVKNKDGGEFDGWCWPGSSSYLDVLSPAVRSWWASKFSLNNYAGSTKHLFIWNDMNEPSVFNGPEVTMPKDNLHVGDVEHREVHNLYGYNFHAGTVQGLVERSGGKERPFVLSRAFFAGTQRLGPIWTGDNAAEWSHLRVSLPMLLSLGVTGITFSGADVGGFFGNPDPELLTRWYQVGAYYPFFRGHAHLDTKRREPWLFGEPYTSHIRAALRTRYALLPYLYTAFWQASIAGMPVLRPLWAEFPQDVNTHAIDDAFLLGSGVLVAPVMTAAATARTAYLPGTGARWYQMTTGAQAEGGAEITVPVDLSTVPVWLRGGTILTRRDRARRSTAAMAEDPYTLVIALNATGGAEGLLYLDDGRTFAHQQGAYAVRGLAFATQVAEGNGRGRAVLTCAAGPGSAASRGGYITSAAIERLIILGLPSGSEAVSVGVAGGADAGLRGGAARSLEAGPGPVWLPGTDAAPVPGALVVRKPELRVMDDWSVEFVWGRADL